MRNEWMKSESFFFLYSKIDAIKRCCWESCTYLCAMCCVFLHSYITKQQQQQIFWIELKASENKNNIDDDDDGDDVQLDESWISTELNVIFFFYKSLQVCCLKLYACLYTLTLMASLPV